MSITEGTQPAVKTWTGAWTTAQTTASFTPEAGALLVALVSADGSGGSTTTGAVTDSLSGTWTILKRQNAVTGVLGGTAEVWCRDSPGSALTVSATGSGGSTTGGQLVVRTLIGALATASQNGATGGASITSAAVQISVAAGTGSRIYGAAFNYDTSTVMTALANTTVINAFSDTTNGDDWEAFTSAADTAGTATYGYSTTHSGMIAAVEFKAAAGAASIPTAPQRLPQGRDPGEAWWLQRDRRDANTTGTAANPLPMPLAVAAGDDVQRSAARWPLPFAAGAVYGQRDRRDANTLGSGPTPADPLTLPDAIARQRMPAEFTADRRLVPQQPLRLADQSSPPPVLFDPILAGPSRTATAAPATHADRREVPQQRVVQAAPDDVVIVGTGALGAWWGEDAAVAYMAGNLPRPPVPQPAAPVLFDPILAGLPAWLESAASWHTPTAGQQRTAVADQSTAPPPLFDPTLSGFPAWLENEPVTHWRPAGPPVQRGPVADQSTSAPVLFDPTQAGLLDWLLNEAATHWRTSLPQQRPVFADPTLQPQSDPTLFAVGPGRVAVTWPVDRREVPQQRPYVSDPSFYPTVAPTDPLTIAYGAGGTYWLLYNTAAVTVDRREVPQQRPYRSDPPLLASSLLENELLGGAGTLLRALVPATHADRREVPAQRPVFVQLLPPVPADPTLLGYLVARIARTWATPDGRTWRPQQRAVLFAYGATPPYVRAGRLTIGDRPVSHLTQAAATTGGLTGSARSTASLTPDTT